MVCYDEPVSVNLGVLFRASSCESWCGMQTQWLCIMMYYLAPVAMNHGVLF